eukprot:104436-Hanusia_phi.AAC.1
MSDYWYKLSNQSCNRAGPGHPSGQSKTESHCDFFAGPGGRPARQPRRPGPAGRPGWPRLPRHHQARLPGRR